MDNALDTFRAQRESADQVHARLTEVALLLEQLTRQVDAVAGNADLQSGAPRRGSCWRTSVTSAKQERLRFWPGVWRRWVLAVVFALASAAAAGAGYAWWTESYVSVSP